MPPTSALRPGGPTPSECRLRRPFLQAWGPPPSVACPGFAPTFNSVLGVLRVLDARLWRPPPMPRDRGTFSLNAQRTRSRVANSVAANRQTSTSVNGVCSYTGQANFNWREMFNEFFNFLSVRAFNAGAEAFRAGHLRHAPAFFGVYSGSWVEGWDEANLACLSLTTGQFPACF